MVRGRHAPSGHGRNLTGAKNHTSNAVSVTTLEKAASSSKVQSDASNRPNNRVSKARNNRGTTDDRP